MKIIGNNPAANNAEITAVASGTLPSGQPVVVNADGTVSAAVSSGSPASVGAASVFETGSIEWAGGTYDSNSNKVVFVYKDDSNSDYGTAVVGTVSGTSISFGTPVIYASINTDSSTATFDSNSNKVVVSYYKNNVDDSFNIVGTVSGTSISFGAEDRWSSTPGVANIGTTFDSSNNKVIIAYPDPANSYYGTVLIGTVSGTSITTGSENVFQTARVQYPKCAFDTSSNKVIISYFLDSNSVQYAVVGTVSGSSISFGSPSATGITAANGSGAIVYDSTNNKTVIATRTSSNGGRGEAVVGTVSGTSISFGTPVEFTDFAIEGGRRGVSGAFNSDLGQVVLFVDGDGSGGKVFTGTVSGTSISFDSGLAVTTGASDINEIAGCFYDAAAEKIVVGYGDASNSSRGTANVVTPNTFSTNLTSENYIGMSGGAIEVESGTQAIGSPAVFESASSVEIGSAYDANAQRVVVAYRDGGNSNYGTAVVGTVSGTSISFGTPVVFESAVARYSSVAYDANAQKVVIAYKNDGNNESTAIVGTVSGTTISFGTAVVFGTASSNAFAATYDTNAQKVVIAYMTTNDNGIAIVGTISGTSISFGTPTQLENSRNSELAITYDANAQKVVVAYKDLENSNYGTAVVGTVSGTSISFGTPAVFNTGTSNDNSIAYDANAQKVVISYVDGGNSSYGTAIVGTVSGTSISFGSAVVFESGGTVSYNSIVYDPTAKRLVNFYRGGSVGKVAVGNVSGTSISFDTPSQFESGAANHNSAVYDSNTQKVVVAYEDGGNSGYGTSVVFQTGYTNINRGQVADGDNAVVDIGSAISTNQVGLTAGQQYFVQTDGTLGLTAADPSVIAGTAVSATDIIVTG